MVEYVCLGVWALDYDERFHLPNRVIKSLIGLFWATGQPTILHQSANQQRIFKARG